MTLQTQHKTRSATVGRARHSLTKRKQQVTREAITDAAADAIRELGLDFSVQDVADRAGVTHRTVYRHFEDREALVDAIGERFEQWLAEEGLIQPQTLDDLPRHIEALFRLFDQFPDLVRGAALLALTRGQRTAGSKQRTVRWRRIFEAELPRLPRGEVQSAFAVWRTLSGTIGWYLLSSQFGLSGARSGPAVRGTLEAMIADLRKRNDEAATGR
jgi:AcrR family transcriptional regulator